MLVKSRLRRGFIPLVVVLILAIAGTVVVGYSLLKPRTLKNADPGSIQNVTSFSEDKPAPTPFPFQELTIPYLQGREYQSKLGELDLVSSGSGYKSYLTSYDSDGLRINGLLTIPDGGQPTGGWPAIVFVHGYIPPQNYRTTQNYVSYVDYLAARGFVVFKIDLRGHDKSEGEPGGGYYSGDYVIDTLNAHAALQNAGYVNPDKIYLWGHSMAGNVVFRSFVASGKIKKVVIWAGAVYTYEDMAQFRISDNSYQPPPDDSLRARRRRELFDTYGNFDPESDFWKQVPATNYLTGVVGSLQIHHAIDDPVVNIGYSRNLMSVLDGTSIDHELVEHPSGGHNITGANFTDAMAETVAFFKD